MPFFVAATEAASPQKNQGPMAERTKPPPKIESFANPDDPHGSLLSPAVNLQLSFLAPALL